jgi:lipoprotein-anchoring transpeptidase ErfK/SrfK
MKRLLIFSVMFLAMLSGPAMAGSHDGARVSFLQKLFQPSARQEQATARAARPQSQYKRQTVKISTPHEPGTVIVDTKRKFLYLVLEGGEALRYGAGVARPGFEWTGTYKISRKAEWPDWRPPASMRRRQPYLPAFVPGGPENPLGARALYIGSTLYRVHGTSNAASIGGEVSSGCIRLMNEDVIDLYERVPVGAKIVVF